MIAALTLLLACQLAGEVVARGLGLPIPGPVLGLMVLATGLWLRDRFMRSTATELENTELGRVAAGLLGNLALLFVPAGAGVVQHLELLRAHGLALAVTLVGSTVATLLVTVATFLAVKRLQAGRLRGDDR